MVENRTLESLAVLSRYAAGESVYRRNDPTEYWYRVIRGAARKSALSADGRRHIVDFILPGDFFGFALAQAPRFCVEAIFPATLIARYPRLEAERLADSNPQIGRRIRELAFDSIARMERRMVILGRFRALEKVSAFLLEMADRNPLLPGSTVSLPMSRYDIADYLGLAVETVSRALTELRDRHVILFRGVRQVRLCDRAALEGLAERLSQLGPARPHCTVRARLDRERNQIDSCQGP
jgi:CRP/FNR family transcriptional regulator, nitrogen fixation regulation protein